LLPDKFEPNEEVSDVINSGKLTIQLTKNRGFDFEERRDNTAQRPDETNMLYFDHTMFELIHLDKYRFEGYIFY